MPDINCRVKRVGPRVALVWGILGLIMLLPASVWARGHTVYVSPPNLVDDTTNIQAALDACVAHGKGCHVLPWVIGWPVWRFSYANNEHFAPRPAQEFR